MSQAKDTINRARNFHYSLILEGIAVGVFAGIVIVLFRLAISAAEKYMGIFRSIALENPIMLGAMFLALLVLCGITMLLLRWEPMISGSGIPQIKGEMTDRIESKWYRVLAYKFIGGVIAIGSGLSLGREGPSVQLGAMAGKGFSRMTKRLRTEEKLLMTCGAGAGLSAAFNAPLAGVVFALEELHKNFSEDVLLSTMAAAITADFVSRYVFGLEPIFAIDVHDMMPLKYYGLVILLGVILGAMGVLYNYCIKKSQDAYGKINKNLRLVIPFVLAGILGIVYPYVLGGGSHIVEMVADGQFMLKSLLILFAIKYIYSMISFGSGSPGGIFLPLLVMGSVLGGAFFFLGNSIIGIDECYMQNFVILGMAGYFAAIVRAPVTGVILISEMTGSLTNLLTLSLVSLAAYVTADVLKGMPIYNQLLERIISGKSSYSDKRKVLIDSPVYIGAKADGMSVSELNLPKGDLIVSIIRDEGEIVPSGDTKLRGGDKITLLVSVEDTEKIDKLLDSLCRKTNL